MQDNSTSVIETRRSGGRIVIFGVGAVVSILLICAAVLLLTLPDANAFNARVEQLFMENDALTGQAEIKLLEILAQSGTAFADTLSSYRLVILVLLVFATAMMIAALVCRCCRVRLTHVHAGKRPLGNSLEERKKFNALLAVLCGP